jgi:methionyl-tRNA synthetase
MSYYITTPIYYVNDKPHIGHAYTTLACDVIARFKRLDGESVYFLTGTDEHGQKVEKSARTKGVDPQAFTDEVSQNFRDLAAFMHYSNDDFIRTTEARHKKGAQAFWKRLEAGGYIYKDSYAGWYSVRDEAYYAESELVDGNAPTGAPVEWVDEESYFFKLSAFQDKLLAFYEENPDFIYPASRRNEVISFVRGGKDYEAGALKDLSISRTTFNWGVPVPGDDKHVMYVWLDALTNYMTALGYPENDDKLMKYWYAKDGKRDGYELGNAVHVVGKDILRFHAVYWPAFLMAADLPLPKRIIAHGWWTNEGQKISKSLGNVIDPIGLVNEFGLDPVRYFLLREVPFGNDGNYSRESMINRINAELANNIGNLAQRTLSMIQKNCEGKVPGFGPVTEDDKALLGLAQVTHAQPERIHDLIRDFRCDMVLDDIVRIAGAANEYIDRQAPWTLKKEDPARMASVLYMLAETVRCIGIMLQPFMPDAAAKMLGMVGYEEAATKQGIPFNELRAEYALKPGTSLPQPEGVFPRFVAGDAVKKVG